MKRLFGLILVFVLAASFVAFGNGKKEDITLKYWLIGNPTSEADQGKPADQWYITQAAKRFEAKTGIKVEISVFPEQGPFADKFKAAGIAKNGPDVSGLWTGGMMFDNKDFILPLDKYFSKDELAQIAGMNAFRLNYKPDGTLLGVPYADQNDSLVLFYNKDIFRKAGISDKEIPTDMDSLFAACEKIKKIGITPMAIGDQEGYYSAFMLLPLYASVSGAQGIRDIIEGRQTFSGDKDYVATARAYHELFARGYTNPDVVSLNDSAGQSLFSSGKAAMICTGPWMISAGYKLLGDNLGMTKWVALRPDAKYKGVIVGGPGQGYCVTSYSKYPEQSVQFLKFLMTKDELVQYITIRDTGTGATPYKAVPADTFKDPYSKMLVEFNKTAPLSIPWMDNQLPQEVGAEFYRMSPLVLSGAMSVEQYVAKLDEVMKKNVQK
jgi:raffinose/stachyose/melibiose transport system substrate-binding protein